MATRACKPPSLSRLFIICAALGTAASCAAASDAAARSEADTVAIKAEDPCDLAVPEIILKSSRRARLGFLGVFELRPAGQAKGNAPFIIRGWRDKKTFHVDEPDAIFEFRDLTGQWRSIPDIRDIFESPPHQLPVTYGNRAEFTVDLPAPDFAADAIEWRLVLRSAENKQCSTSIPFKVRQKRGPVTGFISAPMPTWLKTARKPEPCACSKEKSLDATAPPND